MPMCRNLRLTAGWVVWIVLVAPCLVQAAEPPNLDIRSEALSGSGAEYEGQIITRVQYWKKRIAEANSILPIAEARQALIEDYGKYRENPYKVTYARVTAEELVELFGSGIAKGDALRSFRQISAAVAISKMPQASTLVALEVMVTDENPAVRYLGWSGYRRARNVLSASQSTIKKMLDALKSAAAKEPSSPVVGEIFEMFNIPMPITAPNDPTVKSLRMSAFPIIEANWDKWCQKVRNGDLEMAKAMDRGVRALGTLSTTVSASSEGKTKLLQMLYDLMICSSEVWNISGEGSPLLRENGEVLRAAEKLTAAVSGKLDSPVARALVESKEEELATEVQLAVSGWFDTLKAFGVVEKGTATTP